MMDASVTTTTVDADLHKVYNLFLNVENSEFPTAVKQRSTVIKFTKIPPHDEVTKGVAKDYVHVINPRLRRIITLEDSEPKSPRSLRSNVPSVAKANRPTRKIATITDDNQNDVHPKFSSKESCRSNVGNLNRAVQTDLKEAKVNTGRTPLSTSRNVQSRGANGLAKKDANTARLNQESRPHAAPNTCRTDSKPISAKERVTRTSRSTPPTRHTVNSIKSNSTDSELKINIIKNKLQEDLQNNEKTRKPISRHITQKNKPRTPSPARDVKPKKIDYIRVPIEPKRKSQSPKRLDTRPRSKTNVTEKGTTTDPLVPTKNALVSTEPPPETVDRLTQMEGYQEIICQYQMKDVHINHSNYDSLNVPDVSLINKSDVKENLSSQSMPNLQIPTFKISPAKKSDEAAEQKNLSYIIGEATLTYTTKQKINFHVYEKNISPCASPLSYPLSVVSVLRNQLASEDAALVAKRSSHVQSNCSPYGKLVKPSDIIRTMRFNNHLANDYISEQFVRELKFIDSFFESLQYLESCSLSDRSLDLSGSECCVSGVEVAGPEYGRLLAHLDDDDALDDARAMASKNLCLLNLLIRDEQRRAKNLLFVLKMREDALKDFTKSQILWLENKKKHDSTDISTLKKKQRGALLKLQQECGEMQRMRKALLALSEKRKAALMKTKKNIELKLKSNVDVETILSGKKKIRRSTTTTDRSTAPLKCFDLTSSGCDELVSSRNPEVVSSQAQLSRCSEKGIQTVDVSESKSKSSDTLNRSLEIVNRSTECSGNVDYEPAGTSCVVVDGGYLNILFQNLCQPHIFSSGKQYEVNEEALQHVLYSATTQQSIDAPMDLVVAHTHDINKDESSSPSTARSLVDELDQYYKGMAAEEEKSYYSLEEEVCEVPVVTSDSGKWEEGGSGGDTEGEVTGPLPVPPGASTDSSPVAWTANNNLPVAECTDVLSSSSSASETPIVMTPSVIVATPSNTALVDCEAERLRRQQLAIEREIKALEQQQCMLLVREIPDKPPPPYTPPITAVTPPKRFAVTPTLEKRVLEHMTQDTVVVAEEAKLDAFDAFVKDFCEEVKISCEEKMKTKPKPWESSEDVSQSVVAVEPTELAETAIAQMKDVFTPVPPSTVSGLGTRRADHIDDVLMAEWRFREREWTSLHTHDSDVKEQLAQAILQATVDDAIRHYKEMNS